MDNDDDALAERALAVADVIAAATGGHEERRAGAGPAAMEAILRALLALAARAELFPPQAFPAPSRAIGAATARSHALGAGPGGHPCLWLVQLPPGIAIPAHGHGGRWAAFAAVEGRATHAVLSASGPDGPENREAPPRTVVVAPGYGLILRPGEGHAVSVAPGDGTARHLHLHGGPARAAESRPARSSAHA